MTRSQARARVAVKMFVEKQTVAPVFVALKLFRIAQSDPMAAFGGHEDPRQTL